MSNKALIYGKHACDTMIRKFRAEDLPPKGGFHYHQGVFLSGMMNIYSLCKEEKYYEYIKGWVDSIITEPGVITSFAKGALDDYMAGILLFPLYEREKDEKYKAALDLLMGNIRNWLKNEYGGFWHKEWNPEQMWLDGLYMAGPLQALYGERFNKPYFLKEAAKQAFIMFEHMYDKKTGLLFHAWDSSFEMPWADKKTGLSPEFWGRAMGWYVVAILDIMEHLDKNSDEYKRLFEIENSVLQAVVRYRDEKEKLWYQVIDKGGENGNWLEASCSCLFTYALAKSVRLGVGKAEWLDLAKESFDKVLNKFTEINGEDLLISGVCIGTGVMDYGGYIKRPTSVNDLHGMGAFLLMCAEIARAE